MGTDENLSKFQGSGPASPYPEPRSGPVHLTALAARVLKHHDDYFRARSEVVEATKALRAKPCDRTRNRARDAIAWAGNAERRLNRSAWRMREAVAGECSKAGS